MEIHQIVTEEPIRTQWQLLSQFTYPSNIVRYLNDKGISVPRDDVLEYISGCIRQAEAYFCSASNAPLDISPLLVYYGTSNLLVGVWAILKGEKPNISEHGMKLSDVPLSASSIANISVLPCNPTTGALQQLCNVFSPACKIVNGSKWTLQEILGSIPDIWTDYKVCYENTPIFTVPVEIVQSDVNLERIPLSQINIDDLKKKLLQMENFDNYYLKPRQTKKFLILYRKLASEENGVFSISGQKYLQLPHQKNQTLITPSQLILFFMGLYLFGMLSRYHPDYWHPFVRTDETGERLLVERFITVAVRYIPNLVLNSIYNRNIQLSGIKPQVLDVQQELNKDAVEEIVNEILRRKGL